MKFLVCALLVLAACDPALTQLTFAPPGAVADLDEMCEEIVVTRGVAFAVTCGDGIGCEDLSVSVSDPTIADAHLMYTADPVSEYRPGEQATAFVVVGRTQGTTDLFVESCDGDVTLRVTVEAP